MKAGKIRRLRRRIRHWHLKETEELCGITVSRGEMEKCRVIHGLDERDAVERAVRHRIMDAQFCRHAGALWCWAMYALMPAGRGHGKAITYWE